MGCNIKADVFNKQILLQWLFQIFVYRGNFMTISGEAYLRHVELYTSIQNNTITNMYGHQVHSVTPDLTTSDNLIRKRVKDKQQWNTIDDELINISSFHRISCTSALASSGQANVSSKPLLISTFTVIVFLSLHWLSHKISRWKTRKLRHRLILRCVHFAPFNVINLTNVIITLYYVINP